MTGQRFTEIEPLPLFVLIDVSQTEIILFDDIQLLADVIEQVLSLAFRLEIASEL